MPQLDVSEDEAKLISQSRANKAKVAAEAAYDTAALEETELEATPRASSAVGGGGTTTPPAPPKHHPFIVEKARLLGISDHDIEAMSEESLTAAIRGAEQYAARERNIANQRQDARVVEQVRPSPPPKPEPKPDEEDAQIIADLGLDVGKWEPEWIKLEIRKEKIRRRDLAEIRGEIKQTKQVAQMSQAQQEEQAFDTLIARIGRDREFGTGPSQSLRGTPALDRRQAVYNKVILLGGLNEANFNAAVEILYGKARPKPAAETPANGEPLYGAGAKPVPPRTTKKTAAAPTEDDFAGGVVARPTNRRGAAEVKGEKRAEARIAEAMREQGINPDDDDLGGADEGFLPGG